MVKRQKRLYKSICLFSNALKSITDIGTNIVGGIIYIALAYLAVIGYITIGKIIVYAK